MHTYSTQVPVPGCTLALQRRLGSALKRLSFARYSACVSVSPLHLPTAAARSAMELRTALGPTRLLARVEGTAANGG